MKAECCVTACLFLGMVERAQGIYTMSTLKINHSTMLSLVPKQVVSHFSLNKLVTKYEMCMELVLTIIISQITFKDNLIYSHYVLRSCAIPLWTNYRTAAYTAMSSLLECQSLSLIYFFPDASFIDVHCKLGYHSIQVTIPVSDGMMIFTNLN